jgi:hypothetical protein
VGAAAYVSIMKSRAIASYAMVLAFVSTIAADIDANGAMVAPYVLMV